MTGAGPSRRWLPGLAVASGATVGVLGGLLGLGGAEFRLPLLVLLFRCELRHAVALNVAISLVTVVAGAATRLSAMGSLTGLGPVVPLAAAMAGGGVLGALAASAWLTRVSEVWMRTAIRLVLFGIGTLLIVEGMWPWHVEGLVLTGAGALGLATGAGVVIGLVAGLLGVAGGELIIPTLVYAFGVDVRTAGTVSLLISVPILAASLWRQGGALAGGPELRSLVVPMWAGSALGAVAGGTLAAMTPSGVVKIVLGTVLLGSALHVFGGHAVNRWKELAMKISARNLLKGRVVDVIRGATTAHVKIDIGSGVTVTASITNEAVEDLALAAGDVAYAVIKASDVMVAKD